MTLPRRKFSFLIILPVILFAGLFFSMGFFSKFFNVKPATSSVSPMPDHTEKWATYMTTIENSKVGSILVDLGFHSIAPVKERPYRLRIDLKLNDPDVHGLKSAEEGDILNTIDDALDTALKDKHGALYAGRLNTDGSLYIYFYVGEPAGLESTVSDVMARFRDHKYQHKIDREDDWISYFATLYPEPIQMQSISNGLVIENLRKHGDKLEKKRLVEHWIYFASESDQNKFLESIKGQGFKVEERNKVPDADKPFQLKIAREDRVDYQSVDEYVLDLWQKARDAGGEYDGWETFIVKD